MKKKLLIGGSLIALLAFIWIGAKNLSATAETDVSSGDEGKQYTVDTKVRRGSESEDEEEASPDTAKEDAEVDAASPGAGEPSEESGSSAVSETEGVSGESGSSAESESEDASEDIEPEAVSGTAGVSEEGLLYRIETSAGNNIGMVPIVNGNAVVLMDGGSATTYQGDYSPEEQSVFGLKLEEETALAASEGRISAWAFYREPMMKGFEFPEGVTAIEKFAFSRSGLSSVVIPEGVTSIGYGAFYHCDSLADVTIPASVTTIEEHAFSHTPWLKNWLAEGREGEEAAEDGETAAVQEMSGYDDFLIVGDGILLAYRGNEEEPELPAEVKSVVPGALGE